MREGDSPQGRAEAIRDKLATAAEREYTTEPEQRHGLGRPFEKWSKIELYQRARELGIKNRSTMTKHALIEALRQVGR